jgi:hypothetical protein
VERMTDRVLLILMAILLLAPAAPAQEGKSAEAPKAPEAQASPAPQAAPDKPAETPQAPEPKTGEAAKAPEGDKEAQRPPGAQPQQAGASKTITGKVVDAATKKPLAGAPVTLGDRMVRTDQDGAFSIEGTGEVLRLRAVGYQRRDVPLAELTNPAPRLLSRPKRLRPCISRFGAAPAKKFREAALEALERNNMNALVIDIKGDRGFIPFKVDLPLAEEAGAQKTIILKDYPAFIKSLKEKNIYLIARIVVFKDDPLAEAKPQWAVKTKGGGVFRDREKLRWTDAFHKEVWDYNIAIAKIGAELGFDEIQFDYVRFPDNRGVALAKPSTVESRTKAITGFLEAAYKALIPYNVFVSADVFGYVPWNVNDTDIGQQVKPIAEAVDIVSLMVYPSGYHLGIPKYRNPVQHPYEIVYLTHKKALERTQARPCSSAPGFRPSGITPLRAGISPKTACASRSRPPTISGPAAICSGIPGTFIPPAFSTRRRQKARQPGSGTQTRACVGPPGGGVEFCWYEKFALCRGRRPRLPLVDSRGRLSLNAHRLFRRCG